MYIKNKKLKKSLIIDFINKQNKLLKNNCIINK